MRLHTYTIYSDSGFAPNPYWGYCTLATCKPGIRREAAVGDWVMATGAEKNVGRDRLVYVMRIEEKMAYEGYYRDPRFAEKIVRNPDVSPECRGDNMFFIDGNRRWRRSPLSFRHAELWRVRKDLEGRFVLIAKDDFWYFGREAVVLPLEFRSLIYSGGGDTSAVHDGERVNDFIRWLRAGYSRGKHAGPFECITRESYGRLPEALPDDLLLLGDDSTCRS